MKKSVTLLFIVSTFALYFANVNVQAHPGLPSSESNAGASSDSINSNEILSTVIGGGSVYGGSGGGSGDGLLGLLGKLVGGNLGNLLKGI